MGVSFETKASIVGKIHAHFEEHFRGLFEPGEMEQKGACFYYMISTLIVLEDYGFRVTPMAGSAYYKQTKDGKSYGYEWSPDTERSRLALEQGGLPEIHCFVGLIDSEEIVDVSVRHVKTLAKSAGFPFEDGIELPDFVWGDPTTENCCYLAVPAATIFVVSLLNGDTAPQAMMRMKSWQEKQPKDQNEISEKCG